MLKAAYLAAFVQGPQRLSQRLCSASQGGELSSELTHTPPYDSVCAWMSCRCVYVAQSTFSASDKVQVLQDVVADPTLPRTRDVNCPVCQHNEAVFISEATEKGMTLYFTCVNLSCKHRWKDYI